MSEEHPSETAPPEQEMAQESVLATGADEPREQRRRSGWIAPAWFLFGILVGVIGFAAYNALIVKPPTPGAALDSTTMRAAAREGVLEAIATLQAGGPQQPAAQQQPEGPQVVANNAFTVRDANREGSPDAPVTVYEFSDFQ